MILFKGLEDYSRYDHNMEIIRSSLDAI